MARDFHHASCSFLASAVVDFLMSHRTGNTSFLRRMYADSVDANLSTGRSVNLLHKAISGFLGLVCATWRLS